MNNFTPLVRYLTEHTIHRLNAEKRERILRISQSICILLRSTAYVPLVALPACRPSTCICVRDLTRVAWQAAGFAPFTKPPPPSKRTVSTLHEYEKYATHRSASLSVCLTFYHHFQHTAPEVKYSTMKKLFHDGYFIHSFVNFHIVITITTSSKY